MHFGVYFDNGADDLAEQAIAVEIAGGLLRERHQRYPLSW